ncbi:MAG TPA: hypothetical protein VFF76_03780 [Holophagaceae bacterium]|jgi:hypothetical protein|nr:hypothetical protein [Holophagaceae bacterium]
MRLGTAVWEEGASERRALVSPLADGRFADLNRIERVRQAKLGEGAPEALADALVPSSLRRVLEAGLRGLQRVKQTIAYAEKWARRGDLPDTLAVPHERARLLACLPRPGTLRLANGVHLDRLRVLGPGAWLGAAPEAGLAAVGLAGGDVAGFCLALHAEGVAVLGAWLLVGEPFGGDLLLRAGTHKRHASLEVYEGLELPPLRAGEALLLPPLRLRALPTLDPGADLEIRSAFDALTVHLGPEALHGTVQ